MNSLAVAGVDIGSTMTKVLILGQHIMSTFIGPTGPEYRILAHEVVENAAHAAELELDDLAYVVATGYGRISVPFADKQITEISCHARGAFSLFPSARTIIDIGGQDSKAIKVGPQGRMTNFVMNDKCAAGSGRFLEVIADSLGRTLDELGALALEGKDIVKISTICTVFAEQEVVSHIADGRPLEDVVAGLHDALASRVFSMAERINISPDVVLTGGVAKNIAIRQAFERRLGFEVLLPPEPLLTGALGAAIIARELALKAIAEDTSLHRERRRLEAARFFE
jgi:predicted CoA-substrate-specific enzyme activase